jgi:hypothetical protein
MLLRDAVFGEVFFACKIFSAWPTLVLFGIELVDVDYKATGLDPFVGQVVVFRTSGLDPFVVVVVVVAEHVENE